MTALWFCIDSPALQCSIRLAEKNIIGLTNVCILQTLQQAIDSNEVSDSFLVLTDHHFILKPTAASELAIHRSRGYVQAGHGGLRGWHERRRLTFKTLAERDLPTHDYSDYQISAYEKTKLSQTLAEFDCSKMLVESIYPNYHKIVPAKLKSSWFRFITCSNDWGETDPHYICLQNGRWSEHKAKLEGKNLV